MLENRIHRWSPAEGVSVFLEPSGYAGPELDTLREPGANGLIAAPGGDVLMADSGSRAIARLDLATRRENPLATHYDGRRFNSPNDLVRRSDGSVFFTDPPYGLRGIAESPARELPFSGVYRLDPDGRVTLVDDGLRFPNGIALSPDERTLYVANSDPWQPLWMAYALDAAGAATGRRVFADASDLLGDDAPGLPDGMAVAADGTLLATGPAASSCSRPTAVAWDASPPGRPSPTARSTPTSGGSTSPRTTCSRGSGCGPEIRDGGGRHVGAYRPWCTGALRGRAQA